MNWTRGKLGAAAAVGVLALTGCGTVTTNDDGAGPAAAGDATVFAAAPGPDKVRCTGVLGAERVGDVVVPKGETCRMRGTEVIGKVVVRKRATLHAKASELTGGLQARGFKRVALVDGKVDGRKRWWFSDRSERSGVRYVLRKGESVKITRANINGQYLLTGNRGRIVVRGLYFDVGGLTCRNNRRKPVVRNMSAETPSVLSGQCTGMRNGRPIPKVWGDTDF